MLLFDRLKRKVPLSYQCAIWPTLGATRTCTPMFVGLAYQGKDIVFRFIIKYNSLRDFGP